MVVMENQKDGGILTVLELGTEIGCTTKYGKAVEAQKNGTVYELYMASRRAYRKSLCH